MTTATFLENHDRRLAEELETNWSLILREDVPEQFRVFLTGCLYISPDERYVAISSDDANNFEFYLGLTDELDFIYRYPNFTIYWEQSDAQGLVRAFIQDLLDVLAENGEV